MRTGWNLEVKKGDVATNDKHLAGMKREGVLKKYMLLLYIKGERKYVAFA